MNKDTFLRVGAVSYEGSVFGWDVACTSSAEAPSSSKKGEDVESEGLESNLVFGFHVSAGSMKAIAVSESGKYMICGGMDERIRIFDVGANRAIGELSGHTGCVTSLQFVGDKFIVSGSEDNNLAIWRVQDWMCVHILGGHKASINDLAVHPSGKLALSVSKDNTMKLWNLVQGRCAFTRRLHGPADKVQWSNDGEMYLLVVGSELQIYAASDNNTCISSIKMGSRINQAKFVDIGAVSDSDADKVQHVAIICEDKTFSIVDSSSKKYFTFSTSDFLGDGRPRDLFCCKPNTNLSSIEMSLALEGEGDSIVIVTSTGRMVVFSAKALLDLQLDNDDENNNSSYESAMLSSGSISAEPRLTGVVAWLPHKSKSEKKLEKQQKIDEGEAEAKGKGNKKSKKEEEKADKSDNKKVRFG